MTQEQIDSIRERMCDRYCRFPIITHYLEEICDTCPLDELKASAEPRWIPVTERLPEESGYYLITSNSDYVYDVEIRFFFFQHERRKEWKKGFGDVIAWMPLPEPWKGEENDK